MPMIIRPLQPSDSAACSAINHALPDWFGNDEGLEEADGYLRNHAGLVAESDGEIIGYLTYDLFFPESAEISWMAVSKSNHRRGAGRTLILELEKLLRANAVQLLSVKTLAESHPSPEFAETRRFYMALGFHQQMVFPELWHPSNPCLLMVKYLG